MVCRFLPPLLLGHLPCSQVLFTLFCLQVKVLKGLDESLARFYVGSIVMALEYLHDHNIGLPIDEEWLARFWVVVVLLCCLPAQCLRVCSVPRPQAGECVH